MSEVTHILSAIEQGDPQAAEQLLPLVYDELRKLAAAKQTLEADWATVAGLAPASTKLATKRATVSDRGRSDSIALLQMGANWGQHCPRQCNVRTM